MAGPDGFPASARPRNDTVPITRDYIGKCEKALAIHEAAHRKPVRQDTTAQRKIAD
jgi:cyclopropane-fatty-acyl-phospholipid synthase